MMRIVLACMSDLKMTSLEEIDNLTLREFNYRMWALELDVLRKEFERYKLAFAIRDAATTKMLVQKRNRKRFIDTKLLMTLLILRKTINVFFQVKLLNIIKKQKKYHLVKIVYYKR